MEIEQSWKNIGLKVGLEIHQELSEKKLFCSCSTKLEEEEKVVELARELRAVGGETGDIDKAAKYEQEKGTKNVYFGYKDECCLVDCDESPPNNINQEALETALSLAILLKMYIPNQLIVMRKIITDGSVVSGFQRSILVGIGGENSVLKTTQGDVGIKDLYLEEDSSKIIKKEKDKNYFSLSRQGIPLIELGTHPDIKTPEQAKETAYQIGMILRSFSSVKRGIGTIRQDVNLSIKNGARIEIKGFQDIRIMPKIIKNEIERQINLLKQGKKIEEEVRKAKIDGTTDFLRPMPGSFRLYPETDIPPINIDKKDLEKIKLPKLVTDKINDLTKKYGISNYLASEIIKNDFEKYFKYKLDNKLIANILIEVPKDIKTRFNIEVREENLKKVLEYLSKDLISKDAVVDVLVGLEKGIFDLKNYKKVSVKNLEREIKEIVEKNKGLSVKAVMGIIMKKYKGKVDGKKVFEILNSK